MKHITKTLLAAAALAAGGASQAQADFSVYGVADFSYGRFEPSGSVALHRFNSNSLSASFVGANAKYGLDGGWTPGITLETFVRLQDMQIGRTQRDPLLSRNAFVSLGSDYGTLRVGRLQTSLFDASARFNALGNSVAFSPALRHVFASGNLDGVQGDFYWNRGVSYVSPSIEGVSAILMYAKGQKDDGGTHVGGSLIVNRGLLAVGLAAQSVKADNGIDDPTDETTWQFGATYNFGWARLFGQFTATRDRGLDVKSRIASAGVALPLGPGNVLAQLAQTKTDGPAVDRKHTSASLAYVYPYDSTVDLYVVGMDDRVRGQTRGVSWAAGGRWKF